MKRQQRRILTWKMIKTYSNWEEGINHVHALRKKQIRCFITGIPGNYLTYVHPKDEEKAKI